MLAQRPEAMQLRYLQTLTQIADERTSTIVFPVPVDILGRAARAQALMQREDILPPLAAPFLRAARAPVLALALLLALQVALRLAPAEWQGTDLLRHALALALIAAATWLARAPRRRASPTRVALRYPTTSPTTCTARRIQTQTRRAGPHARHGARGGRRAFALLMTFPGARHRRQPAGLGRRGRHRGRPRREAGVRQPARRAADRVGAADPARRRAGRRGRVGPRRGNRRHLRRAARSGTSAA